MERLLQDLEQENASLPARSPTDLGLHRRRHAEPVLGAVHRQTSGRHTRPDRPGSVRGDHAGGQSRNGRRPALCGLSRGRRQPALHRRPEPFGKPSRAPREDPWPGGCPFGGGPGTAGGLHQPQSRPHVRPTRQTLAQASRDLAEALALQPEHLSYYQLTLEPNTAFHRAPPALPEQDLIADMHQQGAQMLAAAGFAQYEISAYARTGRRCRHNLNYWEFGDYLGIGAGAHGKLTRSGAAPGRAPLEAASPGSLPGPRQPRAAHRRAAIPLRRGPDSGARHERPAAAGGFRVRTVRAAHRAARLNGLRRSWTKPVPRDCCSARRIESDPPSSDRDSSTTSCSCFDRD